MLQFSGGRSLDESQILEYPTVQGVAMLLVSENDDGGCWEGNFPSAWGEDALGNDDDYVGQYALPDLQSRSNVAFADEFGIHAVMSFLRR